MYIDSHFCLFIDTNKVWRTYPNIHDLSHKVSLGGVQARNRLKQIFHVYRNSA